MAKSYIFNFLCDIIWMHAILNNHNNKHFVLWVLVTAKGHMNLCLLVDFVIITPCGWELCSIAGQILTHSVASSPGVAPSSSLRGHYIHISICRINSTIEVWIIYVASLVHLCSSVHPKNPIVVPYPHHSPTTPPYETETWIPADCCVRPSCLRRPKPASSSSWPLSTASQQRLG